MASVVFNGYKKITLTVTQSGTSSVVNWSVTVENGSSSARYVTTGPVQAWVGGTEIANFPYKAWTTSAFPAANGTQSGTFDAGYGTHEIKLYVDYCYSGVKWTGTSSITLTNPTPKYWNDVNVYNPDGVQDYLSAYFDLYTSENNSWRYNLLNEDSDMTHTKGTYFQVQNIRPYYDYYEVSSVTGYDSTPASGAYRKTFDAADEVLAIYMRYKSYYRDINAYQPDGSTQSGLIFDYVIKNRAGTVVDTYTNVTNEVANTVTREYGYTGTISNIRTNVTGAHYTSNNITNSTASSFSWTFNNTNAVCLYSAWNTYTVKYNGNGNTGGSTANSSHTYNTAKALTSNGFTKTGYDFKGWATSATGGVAYTNGQSVSNLTATNGGTVNLYAVWEVKKFYLDVNGRLDGTDQSNISPMGTFKISINGGTKSGALNDYYTELNYGTTYTISDITENVGYDYTGVAGGSLSGTITSATSVRLGYQTMATMYANVGGTWKKGDVYVNVGGTWKRAKEVHSNVSGTWKKNIM